MCHIQFCTSQYAWSHEKRLLPVAAENTGHHDNNGKAISYTLSQIDALYCQQNIKGKQRLVNEQVFLAISKKN